MANRIIGIEFNRHWIRAAQVVSDGNGYRLERKCNLEVDGTEEAVRQALCRLGQEKGFDRRAGVSAVIRDQHTYYQRVISSSEELDSKNTFQLLESDFPVPLETLIIDHRPFHSPPVQSSGLHKAAVERDYFEHLLDWISQAGFRCELADLSAFALSAAAGLCHSEMMSKAVICFCQEGTGVIITVMHDGDVVMIRNIKEIIAVEEDQVLSNSTVDKVLREIEMTWRAVYYEQIPEETQVILAGPQSLFVDLIRELKEQYSCRVKLCDLNACARLNVDDSLETEYVIALGAALRGLSPEQYHGMNFTRVLAQRRRVQQGLKKELAILCTLAVMVILTIVGAMAMQRYRLEQQYALVSGEIRHVFQQTLPDEKTIVDEVGQLEAELAVKRKEADRFDLLAVTNTITPLDVLSTLYSSSVKAGKITIEEYNVTGQLATVTASSDLFESVYRWQDILETTGMFVSVKVGDIRKQPDGKGVRFSMTLSFDKESSSCN